MEDTATDNAIDVDMVDFLDEDLYAEVESPTLENLTRELNRTDIMKDIRLVNIRGWQSRIRAQSGEQEFKIGAPTAKKAAEALIDLVKTLTSDIPLQLHEPEPPIVCEIESGRALLTQMRPFHM